MSKTVKKGLDKSDQINGYKFASLFANEETRHERIQEIIFKGHCAPYLKKIEDADVEYQIIDFNVLANYIPLAYRTNVTNCSNKTLNGFIENDIFTKEDIVKEYDIYRRILSSKSVIRVDDWKRLTILD